tara:strand:+ start:1309 stop:1650 length:342 start_codon:yes stop_codon:yes gene_type:complete
MKIELYGYEISEAINKYLAEKYGMECYIEDMYIERDKKEDEINLIPYKKDQGWNGDKWVVHNEYEIDGVYIKRKKKGGKKSQYVKLDKNDFRDACLNENQGNMVIWVLDKEGY